MTKTVRAPLFAESAFVKPAIFITEIRYRGTNVQSRIARKIIKRKFKKTCFLLVISMGDILNRSYHKTLADQADLGFQGSINEMAGSEKIFKKEKKSTSFTTPVALSASFLLPTTYYILPNSMIKYKQSSEI